MSHGGGCQPAPPLPPLRRQEGLQQAPLLPQPDTEKVLLLGDEHLNGSHEGVPGNRPYGPESIWQQVLLLSSTNQTKGEGGTVLTLSLQATWSEQHGDKYFRTPTTLESFQRRTWFSTVPVRLGIGLRGRSPERAWVVCPRSHSWQGQSHDSSCLGPVDTAGPDQKHLPGLEGKSGC